MAIRFVIKDTAGKAEVEGNEIVRYSGISEQYKHSSERASVPTKLASDGKTKLLNFITGLDTNKVKFYKWFTEAERKEVTTTVKELSKTITEYYGHEVLAADNRSFWKDTYSIGKLSITPETEKLFFDTSNVEHALLYLSIIGGAFMSIVAPNKEWAIRYEIPHYIVLEDQLSYEDDSDDVTKSDAHAMLHYLKNEQPDALFILAWCLQYETTGFGAYNKSTSLRELVSYHIKFINGDLVTKKKRNCAKEFIDYADKWKAAQTRPKLYTEAYVKAGDYHSFIQTREKKFVTNDGTVLGNTISEAVENLSKVKFSQDLENLRDLVEAKWKE